MSSEHATKVPLSVLDGSDGLLFVKFNFSPGTPDVWYLPNGDPGYPGDPPELEILAAHYCNDEEEPMTFATVGLAEHKEEAIAEWLLENIEQWAPTDPDPDDDRDRRIDDELCG